MIYVVYSLPEGRLVDLRSHSQLELQYCLLGPDNRLRYYLVCECVCVWLCMHMCVCVCLCVYVCEEVSFTFRIISTCLDISNIVWMILLLKNLCKAHTRTHKPC